MRVVEKVTTAPSSDDVGGNAGKRSTVVARKTRRLASALAALLAVFAMSARARSVAAPRGGDAPEIYAVIIGYNGGGTGLPTLRFADDDAVRFALFFSGLDAPDRSSRVWLLSDLDAETTSGLARAGLSVPPRRSPTRAALFAVFDEVGRALAARARPEAPVALYVVYAGHGLKGRILMKPEEAPEAAVTGRELRAAVAELAGVAPALRSYLFFDACRSQSLFTERGGDGAAELGPDLAAAADALEARASAVPIGVLTAASSGKPAGEVSELGAGYFSHVLASGLAGAADADGDDVVSFGELAAFVAFNTERLTGQRPWFSPPGGDLRAPAMDHRGRRTRLDLSAAAAGRYLIEAAPGRPVFAEAWKGDRRPLRLSLPPGRYRVLHGGAGDSSTHASRADVTLVAGAPADLARAAWAEAAAEGAGVGQRGADPGGEGGAVAGHPEIPVFSAAFTPDVVSTLTAGYDAGREPPAPVGQARNTVEAGLALGSAPLDLRGSEPEVWLGYRRILGPRWFAAGSVHFARSSQAAAEPYSLERGTVLIGGGARVRVTRRLEVAALVLGGGGPVLRRAGDVTGDWFAPGVAAGIDVSLEVGGGWSVRAGARYLVQWIAVDGARRASSEPRGELGAAFAF
ncbi:MAG TPA: hypothetical protein VIU64_14635 [Polyangia bacterium]